MNIEEERRLDGKVVLAKRDANRLGRIRKTGTGRAGKASFSERRIDRRDTVMNDSKRYPERRTQRPKQEQAEMK
eukprot:scaffold1352_cov180-Amphora_coffeaeformis.AAC.4